MRYKMKNILSATFMSILIFSLAGCNYGTGDENKAADTKEKEDKVVNIITERMEFQTVDTLPSGWHTFAYHNKSYENHFFLLDKYPEGKRLEDGEKEVIPVFQKGMDLINEGKTEEGYAAFGELPAWFFDVKFLGGSGLVSPGQTAYTTLKLEPGYYVIECYVKMANGIFHSSMGMVKELIVTSDTVMNAPPDPDVNLTISSDEGIIYKDEIKKGKQTFSVYFKDQITHENFVGHDVHLVKLDENADPDQLEMWMNWANPEGLKTPAPEGLTYLGGVNDLPAGWTGYFTATLEPGNYAFVSEVPDIRKKNMYRPFIVLE